MFRFDAPGCCRLSLRNLLFGIHVAMWLLYSMLLTADTRSFKDSLSGAQKGPFPNKSL